MVNWLNKLYEAGSRIKAAINKRRATKEELAQSNYVSCCVGLVSKKELADNFHCCPHCSKHFKITLEYYGLNLKKDEYVYNLFLEDKFEN